VKVTKATGETLTTAIVQSPGERPSKVRHKRVPRLSGALLDIGTRSASLPVQDVRSADEIISYDASGLPR
jgi:hypothetical protein